MAYAIPGILVVTGVLILLIGGWQRLRAPANRLCPGHRITWPVRLWPLWLVYRPRCGYDLSAHTWASGRSVTCPECGRVLSSRRELIRAARAWRPVPTGCVLLLAGVLVYRYPLLTATKLVEYAPTEMLLRGEGFLGAGTPLEVRHEIRKRALDHQLRDDQICRFVDLLVRDLRDDALNNNAKDAIQQLAIFGVFCVESLMAALNSDDLQQRALAAQVLRSLPNGCVDHAELIRASVEDLRSDRWPQTRSSARWYLQAHLEEAKPLLIEAIREGDDVQQELIASLLRATTTEGPTLDWLLRISVTDLCDDEHRWNFSEGRRFLRTHLEQAQPLLLALVDSDDRQQRDAVWSLLRECQLEGEALDRALRLSVDQLRLGSGVWNTGERVSHLTRNAESAEPLLLEGMRGDDRRQRLLCAVAAGCGGRVDIAETAIPILVEHLGDNQLGGDAIVAARAIWGFGLAALPSLQLYRTDSDEQRRQVVEYIVRRLTTTESIVALQIELPLARLTRARVDALALEPTELRMPHFPE